MFRLTRHVMVDRHILWLTRHVMIEQIYVMVDQTCYGLPDMLWLTRRVIVDQTCPTKLRLMVKFYFGFTERAANERRKKNVSKWWLRVYYATNRKRINS